LDLLESAVCNVLVGPYFLFFYFFICIMGRIVRPAMARSYVFHFSLMKNLYAKHCKICNVAVVSSISI
jgi:hypothetical protein